MLYLRRAFCVPALIVHCIQGEFTLSTISTDISHPFVFLNCERARRSFLFRRAGATDAASAAATLRYRCVGRAGEGGNGGERRGRGVYRYTFRLIKGNLFLWIVTRTLPQPRQTANLNVALWTSSPSPPAHPPPLFSPPAIFRPAAGFDGVLNCFATLGELKELAVGGRI